MSEINIKSEHSPWEEENNVETLFYVPPPKKDNKKKKYGTYKHLHKVREERDRRKEEQINNLGSKEERANQGNNQNNSSNAVNPMMSSKQYANNYNQVEDIWGSFESQTSTQNFSGVSELNENKNASSTNGKNATSNSKIANQVVKQSFESIKKRITEIQNKDEEKNISNLAAGLMMALIEAVKGFVVMIVSMFIGLISTIFSVVLPFIIPILLIIMIVVSILSVFIEIDSDSSIIAPKICYVAEQELQNATPGGDVYKEWYGADGNWCAMFVSYCADKSGCLEIIKKTSSVKDMSQYFKNNGNWEEASPFYKPAKGDIIFFQENGRSHVGIVVDFDLKNNIVVTIEGNTGLSNTTPYHKGSHVEKKSYALTFEDISGYGRPYYNLSDFIDIESDEASIRRREEDYLCA